ncbi:MAG: RNA polymerase sigma factor [Actinomycetes bacterium]
MSQHRPPRCRPLPPEVVAEAGDPDPGVPDAELMERLERALASLPADERAAVVTSFAYDEGTPGVVAELGVVPGHAERLTDRGLARLRDALHDVHVDDRQVYAVLARRRHRLGAE